MENIFNVKYNSKLDRLEIPSENGKFKLLKFFKEQGNCNIMQFPCSAVLLVLRYCMDT